MIRMRVRDQDSVQPREAIDRNSGRSYSAKKARERRIEIRIGQDTLPADLEQERRMADVGHTNAFERAGLPGSAPRSAGR